MMILAESVYDYLALRTKLSISLYGFKDILVIWTEGVHLIHSELRS